MFSEELLRILVPLFTAMLGIAVGYFLKKAEYERKRRDDLADRDFTKRAAVRDMRIKEAMDYINTWSRFVDIMDEFETLMRESDNVETAAQSMMYLYQTYTDFPAQLREFSNNRASIELLNDKELTKLLKDFIKTLRPSLNKIIEASDTMYKSDGLDFEKAKEQAKIEDFENIARKANKIIIKIKARLDLLAEAIS